jgi:hypothetical protein
VKGTFRSIEVFLDGTVGHEWILQDCGVEAGKAGSRAAFGVLRWTGASTGYLLGQAGSREVLNQSDQPGRRPRISGAGFVIEYLAEVHGRMETLENGE